MARSLVRGSRDVATARSVVGAFLAAAVALAVVAALRGSVFVAESALATGSTGTLRPSSVVESLVGSATPAFAASLVTASGQVLETASNQLLGPLSSQLPGLATAHPIALACVLGLAASGDASSDVEQLIDGVRDLASGDADATFDLDRDDELGQLSAELDDLAEEVEERDRKLREYEAFTDDVLDAIDDVFYVLDKEGEHRRWNDAFCEVTGYDDEAVAEMHPREFFVEDQRDRVDAAIDEAFETGSMRTEATILTEDGYEIPFEWVGSRVEAPDGTPVVAGIGRDIVERRAAERERAESERFRRELYEATTDPDLDDDETLERLLALGRERLGVDNGHVARIDPEAGTHEVLYSSGSPIVGAGTVTDLDETFCREILEADGVLSVGDPASDEDWTDHPAHEHWGLECYVGAELIVDGELYGTLCFVDETPRETQFTPAEKTFVDLIARWVSQVYERREEEREREESEHYRHELYEITSDATLDTDQKVRELLDLGCDRLDVECGVVTTVEEQSGRYEVAWAEGSDFVEEGVVTDLSTTYCREVIESGDILGLHDTDQYNLDHPDEGHDAWGIDCYIGGRIEFDAEVYGTLCFVDPEPRSEPFSAMERTFVDLMTRWLSQEFERREYTEELRRKDRALDAAPVGVTVADASEPDNPIVYANDEFESLTGYGPEEYLGRNCRFLQGEDTDPEPVARMREAIDAAEQVTVELKNYRADGSEFWNRVSIAPVENEAGEVTEYIGFQQDVTERTEAEQELRDREQRLQEQNRYVDDVLDSMDDLFYVIDEHGTFERWNESLCEVTGYSDAEIADLDALELVVEEDQPAITAAMQASFEEGSARAEANIVTSDGDEIPYEFEAAALEDPDGDRVLVGVGRDISERRERERQLEALVENTTDPIYIKDRDGCYLFINHAGASYFGTTPAQVVGKHDEELFDEATVEEMTAHDELILEEGEAVTEEVVRPIEGEEHVFLDNKYPYRDEEGEIIGVMGISRDVTERIEYEQLLEARSVAMEESIDGIAILGADEQYTFANQAHAEIYGYDDPAEFVGEDWQLCYPDEEIDRIREEVMPVLREEGSWRGEAEGQRADGSTFPQELSLTVLEDGRMVCVVRDVTERKEYEAELERSERRFQAVFNDPKLLAGIVDPDGRLRQANEPALERVDDDPDEILGQPYWETPWWEGDEELRASIRDKIERAADGEYVDYDAHHQWSDIEEYWSTGTIRPVFDDDGEVESMIVSGRDVTERKERERELERTTDLLSRVESIADIGGYSVDLSGQPPHEAEWTGNLYEIFDLPEDTEPPTSEEVLEFYHPTDREQHREIVEAALEDGMDWDQEVRIVTAEGRERWVRDIGHSVTEDGEVVEIRGAIQDITEPKEYQRELERNRALLQQAQRVAKIGGWELDLRTDPPEMTWSEELYDIHGVETDVEIDLEKSMELYHPEDRERIRETVETAIEEAEPYDMEARVLDGNGDERWVRVIAEPAVEDDEVVTLRGSIQDITDIKRREAELERTKDMLQQAEHMGGVGGWEIDVSDDPYEGIATEAFFDILEIEAEELIQLDTIFDYVHPDEQDWVRAEITRGIESGEPFSLEHRIVTGEGAVRWVRVVAEPVADADLYRGAVLDVTEQKQRELIMEALHETARGLLQTQTPDEVAELAIDTAEDVLDVACTAVYLLDDESGRLEPVAYSDDFEEVCGGPHASSSSEADPLLWEAYVAESATGLSGASTEQPGIFDEPVEEGLYVPIGDHGVFVVASDQHRIEHGTRRIAETLVATMEAALHRLDSETDLREREAELAAQNRRLRRQIQINEIIRTVDQSLIGASSREEIETAVCERLTEGDDVAFAWIGSLDSAGDTLVPRAWAGESHDYLDAISLSTGRAVADPALQTATTGEPTVVESVVQAVKSEEWRKHALVSNFSSVAAVPITFDEYTYGVLAVYGTEPDQFGDLERAVFEELGESIANSINAVETRQALYADAFVELTIHWDESEDFLARVARETGGTVDYVGLGTHSEDESRVFFEVEDAAVDDVEAMLSATVSVEDYRLIADGGESHLFEATVAGEVLAAKLVRRGGVPREMHATASELEVTVDVPASINVREFVESLRENHPSAELVSRQDVQRDVETRQELVNSLFEDLTDRQLEVLRTAYFAGFFGWPRESTGEDIADLLDVSQPTVNRHVRHGLQRLLEQLFEEEPATIAQAP